MHCLTHCLLVLASYSTLGLPRHFTALALFQIHIQYQTLDLDHWRYLWFAPGHEMELRWTRPSWPPLPFLHFLFLKMPGLCKIGIQLNLSLWSSSLHFVPWSLPGPLCSINHLWQTLTYRDSDFLGLGIGCSPGSPSQSLMCKGITWIPIQPHWMGIWVCIFNKFPGAVRSERFRFNSSGVWPSHGHLK